MRRAEPVCEFLSKVPAAGERKHASIGGVAGADMAQANVCQSPEFGYDFKINLEARIKKAHVNLGPAQHEPVAPLRRLTKLEQDDNPAIRQIFGSHQPAQYPHEIVGVEVIVAEVTA